ncbi:MAG: glycosyltransferase family 2 protein [Candidatus Puniceispirillaceae bacterium]
MSDKTNAPDLSIVATVYNSANVVEPLIKQIRAVVESLKINYEIILVDDGSSDDSAFVLEQQSTLDPTVKSIVLSRNFGQQVAMSAGIHHATGQLVLIMDGDLQNPPEAISDLFRKAGEGYDIVYTTSKNKNNIIDSFTSWLFWRFLKVVMGVDIVESQLMMRIMSNRVAQYYREYPEKIRTVAAITRDIGMRQAIIPVQNRKRKAGSSHYNTRKRFNLALDVILDFTTRPLDFLFFAGTVVFVFTGVAILYYIYAYLTMSIMPGFISLVLLILLFGSINLISIGILARYTANIYTEVKHRPLYIVRKTINIEQKM